MLGEILGLSDAEGDCDGEIEGERLGLSEGDLDGEREALGD